MLAYIFIVVLGLSPLLQAAFDLPLQLAFQRAVLLGCLAWLLLGLRARGVPAGLTEKRYRPLWGAAALSLAALAASPLRGYIFNEWGNYAAGLLLLVFGGALKPAERSLADRAVLAGAWLVFAFSLLQVFVFKTFSFNPPLTNLNALALYAVLIIPLALERGAWALTGAMIILMVWTQSVGAAFAALVAAGFYAASRLRGGETKGNIWLLAALAAVAVPALYLLQADSVAGRFAWWQSAAEMFRARPIAGFGHAAFTWAQGCFQPAGAFREQSIYAHNYYLEFLAENGLPAAACWFWFLYTAARARTGLVKYAVIGALAHSFMDFGLSVPANFWLFCYLLGQAGPEQVPAPQGAGRRTALAALALAVLLVAALLSLDLRSLAFEKSRRQAYAAAGQGDLRRSGEVLAPALESALFRAPALEFLGRLNLAEKDQGFKAAVYFEMTLLENRYSAASWRALGKIYAAPGLEAQAAGLERRRREVFK